MTARVTTTARFGRLKLAASGVRGRLFLTVPEELSPLAAAVHCPNRTSARDRRRRLERGERNLGDQGLYLHRPTGEEGQDELAIWERLTGEPPGEDVYVVGTSWDRRVLVVPRRALIALIELLYAR